ncbi:inorganic phosphate transporter family protein [Desulfobacterota bacterium AH_259_B03_O07]|nr:inorganic phosphate transporter family protein [Desulfobacterota bacterium AH_259_B03_O07]
MEFILPVAIVLSTILALNIGANNSAASMATAYGAGIRTKREATFLIAVFALLGAIVAGAPVVKTLGNGIVPGEVLSSHLGLVLIIFVIAIIAISWANITRVPVATTHAIVCAIAGVGIYANALNGRKFLEIIVWWVVGPFIALIINYLIGRFLYFRTLSFLTNRYSEKNINRVLTLMITISGSFLAFSAGSNNSANAVGPLVGIGLLNPTTGAILAGLAMGVGAIVLGGRLLETVGKEITEICILRAVSVEFTGAILIFIASIYGIPISIAEIITSGIIGFSIAQQGFSITAKNRHVIRIALFWLVLPIIAIGISYMLSSIYFKYGISAMLKANF